MSIESITPTKSSHQAAFHQRWRHLNNPHVRTLAWLIDAPGLLDPAANAWHGKVATLGPADTATTDWLTALDRNPTRLHAVLNQTQHKRLGRYAEQLLAFYLQEKCSLIAHGLQVRTAEGVTLGEFDFLLPDESSAADGVVHWEFATKLYLLEADGDGAHANHYVGPNLADTLGLKLNKIMERQLALGSHPAAADVLQKPVRRAQALIKGWLFYRGCSPDSPNGIASTHCRGFWKPVDALSGTKDERFVILPRLAWLAPAKASEADVLDLQTLRETLNAEFNQPNAAPVLIAQMHEFGKDWLETDRGFIVPADWQSRPRNWIKRSTVV